MCVAIMRAEAGRDPHDKGLQDLVGELSTRSDVFRHSGARMTSGPTGPAQNDSTTPWSANSLSPTKNSLITADPGCVLMIYTAEPGSPSAERLTSTRQLGSYRIHRRLRQVRKFPKRADNCLWGGSKIT